MVELAHLSHAFLGSWQVLLGASSVPNFKYDKVRALLTYLVVEKKRPHRREALMDMFWPEMPETAARNNLRQALSALKEALGERKVETPYLLITRASVQFNSDSDYSLDLDQFTNLLDAVNEHPHRRMENCSRCLQSMQQAAKIYRGSFLSDFYIADSTAFEEWATLKREWLHQQAMGLLAGLSAAFEWRGKFSLALQYAQRQIELDPWREEAYRQTIRLYALSGNREGAITQYKKCQQLLNREMGIEPEPETIELYNQILTGNFSGLSPSISPMTGKPLVQNPGLSSERTHNLPPMASPFIGRETELAEIGRLIEETTYRLVTLAGPGGSGKTRLAIQAAAKQVDSFMNGVFFVSLSPVQTPDLLPSAISAALGIEPDQKTSHRELLLKYLKGKEILLILDSFEHLLMGAGFLSDILRQAPDVTLLVSSQVRLNLHDEYVFLIDGLPVPDTSASLDELSYNTAVQLFIQSAQKTKRTFKLTPENCTHVAQICSLTSGLPLAVELAAAWVRALSCNEIADEIGKCIGFLQTELLDVPDRHRSLSAVFDHSWGMLTSEEQAALGGLSIFQGGFSREAGEEVAKASSTLLAALVDKSLLRRNHSGRYEIHEMVRRYVLEKMESSGNVKDIGQKHAAYYLALTQKAEPHLVGPEQAAYLECLREENDNIRIALNFSLEDGEAEVAGRIAASIWRFWQTTGQISEGRAWLERILKKIAPPNLGVTTALGTAANTNLLAPIYKAAGVMAWLQGDYVLSREYFETSLEMYHGNDDQDGIATLYGNLGTLAIHRTDYSEAQTLLEKALDLRRKLGDKWSIASCLNNMGALAGRQGDIERAQTCYQECLDIFQELGYRSGIAISLSNLGSSACDLGQYDRAYHFHTQSLVIRREIGDKPGIANSLSDLGSLAVLQGDLHQACIYYAEGLDLLKELGDKEHSLDCVEGIARIAANEGILEIAACLWGAAECLRETLNVPMPKSSSHSYEEELFDARHKLEPAIWETAWARGKKMNLEQTIAAALTIAREKANTTSTS
jgi:predicted ATPase/DNA-binding SARP family transcriptional activator